MPLPWTTVAASSALCLSLFLQYPPDPAVPAAPAGSGAAASSQPAGGASTQPAKDTPASNLPAGILDPANDAVLDAAITAGGPVKIQGSVASASWARSGSILHINFNDGSGQAIPRGKGVVGIIFQRNKEAFDKAFSGDVAKAIEGKTIEVDGKVTSFRAQSGSSAPVKQIVLDNPSQLKIIK